MATRRTAKQKKQQQRIAAVLAVVLGVALLTAALAAFPALEDRLYDLLGINQTAVVPGANPESATAVHFIAVGQGDAVLIRQDGEYALLDAGPPEGTEALLGYLRGEGVEQLRYIFMSHAHADHIGGMQAVLEQYPVGTVVLPDFTLGPTPTSKLFENLLVAMTERSQSTETAQVGAVYPLGTGGITVLQAGLESDNLNLQSLMLLFEADGIRFLDTGDAEKQNEATLLKSSYSVRASLFKAGHHGSSTSNTAEFISSVRPSLVVVCCGLENSYGHPHEGPMENYAAVGTHVLRTDLHGAVVVQPDGEDGLVYYTQYPE